MGGAKSKPKNGNASPAKQADSTPKKVIEEKPKQVEEKSAVPVVASTSPVVENKEEEKPAITTPPKKESVVAKKVSVVAKKDTTPNNVDAIDPTPEVEEENIEEAPVEENKYPIILDSGSYILKAGFSDSATSPQVLMPSLIGRRKTNEKVDGVLGQKNIYIGKEADDRYDELAVKWPMVKGIVPLSNWEEMEKIWHYAFYSKLRIKPSEHPLIVTEAILTPKANRERLARVMFGTFKIPALYIGNMSSFALFATGKKTGAVLELGDSSAHAVAVVDGIVVPSSIMEVAVSGHDLTEYMYKLISERGLSFPDKVAHDISREVKERYGYVAMDYEAEFEKSQANEDLEKSYETSDGHVVTVGTERFRCPAALFAPQLINPHLEQEGCHASVNACILACENKDTRAELYSNIVLSGGTTMFDGFANKMKAELAKLAPDATINIIRPANRKYLPWVGAAMFGNEPLITLLDKCVTIDEYKSADGSTLIATKFN